MDQLVMVDWEDSAQPVASWLHLTDLPALSAVQCCSVGWIVAQSDDVLMLAPNLGERGCEVNAQASGIIRIPKRCIVRMVPLVEVTATSSSV